MSTGVIVVLIVVGVLVVAAAGFLGVRRTQGGGSLKRRFGPEYGRAVARHDGDVRAAERELTALVERHGGLRERPLEAGEQEKFQERWRAAQERFVESPREAAAEVDQLLGELAGARGYPRADDFDEQVAALAVHHAGHVDGYRHVRHVVGERGADTEDARRAVLEARALFGELIGEPKALARAPRAASRDKDRARAGRSGRVPAVFQRIQAK
ncbi:hypothetical protein DF268_28070 [Streptomyces sp. V2]|uniref:Secreted protein n=1 Tax=Streptomyces niveiscabiei TaxID=164115 RepID=A0ABW9HXV3_9ACTN|nr:MULTISPECIES: hypothetical protein [unclassified Streptomyces]PWG10305.1 hypothetical protein DF268_28070 [Streptomyces sp. V2]QZZ27548.1 hypothetical protein A7X85_15850 [Streptomyces sp. ST1015]